MADQGLQFTARLEAPVPQGHRLPRAVAGVPEDGGVAGTRLTQVPYERVHDRGAGGLTVAQYPQGELGAAGDPGAQISFDAINVVDAAVQAPHRGRIVVDPHQQTVEPSHALF
jgi:hypothetical protein